MRVRGRPWRVLPRLLRQAPVWLLVVGGVVLVGLGLVVAMRPLASVWSLAVYTGVSCVVSGALDVLDDRGPRRWWERVAGAVWIAGGVAVLTFLGRSITLLPIAVAALLVVAGLGSLGRLREGPTSRRVLTGAWGLAQVAVGFVALTLPDVTLLAVAVFFGARTVVFGLSLLGHAIRVRRGTAAHPARSGGARRWGPTVLRWTGAVLSVAVAASSVWVSGVLTRGRPVLDGFYSTPDAAFSPPGRLLRASPWPGDAPDGVRVQRILYSTTASTGGPAVASGLVISPEVVSDRPTPVVLWDHGTTGIARACAPSLMRRLLTDDGIPAVAEVIAHGWVIVAPDYTGQGAAGRFPYLIGTGEAYSSLDAVRAARALTDPVLGQDVVVWGHSQGGHAALWTGSLAPDYAPELHVRGVAAISPAADPRALAGRLLDSSNSALLSIAVAWVLLPYSDSYSDVEFDQHVDIAARGFVRNISQRCTSEPGLLVSVLASAGLSGQRSLYLGNLTSGALGDRLQQNEADGPWAMPVLVAWGDQDEVIAADLQRAYVSKLESSGAGITWREYPGLDHQGIVTAGSPFLPVLVGWTGARLSSTVDQN